MHYYIHTHTHTKSERKRRLALWTDLEGDVLLVCNTFISAGVAVKQSKNIEALLYYTRDILQCELGFKNMSHTASC